MNLEKRENRGTDSVLALGTTEPEPSKDVTVQLNLLGVVLHDHLDWNKNTC